MRRFLARDEEGTVTIEFLLTFPLLVLWLLGSYVFFDVYKSESKASKAAYAVADILSRQEGVNHAELNDYFTLLDRLLPRASDDKWMRVTSISWDPAEEAYFVNWSWARSPGDTIPTLDDLSGIADFLPAIAEGDSVIMLEVEVPYTPIISSVGMNDLKWTPRVVVRPRFIAKVNCPDCDVPGV